MNILDIPLRTNSNPSLSPREINALLTELRQYQHSKRSVQTGIGTSTASPYPDDQYINIKFNKAYDPWSIFTIKPGRPYFPQIATPDSKDVIDPEQVTDDKGQIYCTNGGQATDDGAVFDCYVLGITRPHRIKYTGTTPVAGDRLNVVTGQPHLQKESNGIFVAVSEADFTDETIWVVKDTGVGVPSTLKMVEALTCIKPGLSGTARVQMPSSYTWIPVTPNYDITVYDPLNSNMVLPGERVWVRLRAVSGQVIGDIIGSHGLYRPAKFPSLSGSGSSETFGPDVECNSSATVVIYQSIAEQCSSLTPSTCTVTACYRFGDTRKIKGNEEFWIKYTGKQWHIIPVHRPRWALGVLNSNICGTSPVTVTDLFFLDGCTTPDPTTVSAINDYSLAGIQGDNVLLVQLEDDSWSIVQIQHHLSTVVDQIRYQNCTIQSKKYNMMAMQCGAGAWSTDITLFSSPVITGFRHDGATSANPERCEDVALYKNQCFFESGATPDGEIIFATYSPQVVLQDWDVVGLKIIGKVGNVYVRCYDGPDEVILHTGTDCSSGSGSGGQ